MSAQNTIIRRGLPRTPGGRPWPDAAGVEHASAEPIALEPSTVVRVDAAHITPMGTGRVRRGLPRVAGGAAWPSEGHGSGPADGDKAPSRQGAPRVSVIESGGRMLRRGLPRVAGAEAWPPAGFAPGTVSRHVAEEAPAPAAAAEEPGVVPAVAEAVSPPPAASTTATTTEKSAPRRFGRYTAAQWAAVAIVGGAVLVALLACVVLFAQWLRGLPDVQRFLAEYPGGSELPAGTPVGVPSWMAWQHFFNVFLMVLIIRSGLQIRRETRPPAYWTPKWSPARKISLTVWFHQSLDLLWVINGITFIAMLFVTGQWAKIIPVSGDVIPNALSAGLQYASLHWPTENGWVHYNALQQLAYFTTVFVAAPLAAATGIRMSGIWPKRPALFSRLYPVELARKIHFPVMLYFVAFIIVHVALVFATGALRNLNHMYAAQGSVDADAYAANWTGFWIFAASLLAIAGAIAAARPVVLAPIARLFGSVSSR